MRRESTLSPSTYEQAAEFSRIGNRAVRRAQEESRSMNVPNVYSHNGTLFYELPDGTLLTTNPFTNGTTSSST